jgi:hypothetical protein
MRRSTCLTLLLMLMMVPLWAGAGEQSAVPDFFVSPAGNDMNPGTQEKPFASLKRAQQAVRQRIAQGLNSNVQVVLREGVYQLAEPLLFEADDSGTDRFAVNYAASPGETVIISGGRKIANWQRGEGAV